MWNNTPADPEKKASCLIITIVIITMKVLSVSIALCMILTLSRAVPLNSTVQSGLCVDQKQNCSNSSTALGGFCPKCDYKGNFLPQQCSRSTGYCWCVNITSGQEIPDTRTPPGSVPDCGTAVSNASIIQIPPTNPGPICVNCGHCKNQSQNCSNVPGAFCPKCDDNGNFLPTQCSGSCWCVDVNSGEKIPNTTVPLGAEPDCGKSTNSSDEEQPLPKPDGDSQGCPDGWSRFGKRCFIFIDTPKPWIDAEVYCKFDEANLASIHTHEENRFIISLTREDTDNFPQTWLGGFDAIHPRYWLWSDGSEFNYRNWHNDHTNHDSHDSHDNNDDDDGNRNEEDGDNHDDDNDDDEHNNRDSNNDQDDENHQNDDDRNNQNHDKHDDIHDEDDGGDGNCLKINYEDDLKWFYASCRDSLPFVCVKNVRTWA